MMLSSPTTSSWVSASPLEVLISRACEPSLHEPNYATHIEVAEYINAKKANNPREAAMLIARLANNRNPHISILALALLDTLVQSCGYPFHLQISTKEFLNELVRRFPERPPPFPSPVMSRILQLIHTWKEGICTESRWKEDLGNIRDMHRLLTFKGYRFRDFPRQASSSSNPAVANLKTAEELENEDRDAQSAKLQELIRRGTPRDLAAAQELMKSLAGANPDAKPDYREQALNDLAKLEQNVVLLNEMLDNVDVERGEKFVSGDAYDQVSVILTAARPKIQKWISDAESHDSESLDTFLQINDQINTVLIRYDAYKKGDYATATNPIPKELAAENGPAANESLIDWDDSAPPVAADGTATAPISVLNDLSSLFSSPAAPSVAPASALPHFNLNPAVMTPPVTRSPIPMPFNGMPPQGNGWTGLQLGQAPHMTVMTPPMLTGTPPGSIVLPATPGVPNYVNQVTGPRGPVSTIGMGGMTMGSPGLGMHQQALQQQYHNQQQQTQPPYHQQQGQPPASQSQASTSPPPAAAPAQGKDPFADLAGLF